MPIHRFPITPDGLARPETLPAPEEQPGPRVSACVGCIHNVGDKIRECAHQTASLMTEHYTFVEACAWREAEEPPE